MQLQVGDKAPHFCMPIEGNATIALSDLQGKFVVLYFYPKDNTPGCTIEAKNFNKLQADFTLLNAVIVGVSKDDISSHEQFKKKCGLNFILASDRDLHTSMEYGVWVEKSFLGKKYMGIQRTTFLIDRNGNIAFIWPKVSVFKHAQEVLTAIKGVVLSE